MGEGVPCWTKKAHCPIWNMVDFIWLKSKSVNSNLNGNIVVLDSGEIKRQSTKIVYKFQKSTTLWLYLFIFCF